MSRCQCSRDFPEEPFAVLSGKKDTGPAVIREFEVQALALAPAGLVQCLFGTSPAQARFSEASARSFNWRTSSICFLSESVVGGPVEGCFLGFPGWVNAYLMMFWSSDLNRCWDLLWF